MKIRISELRRIIREILVEDRGFGDQAKDIKIAVDLVVDFLMSPDVAEADVMKIVRHKPVLLAQKVPGFKDALFGILRSVADPDIVKQARESQDDINIAFTFSEDQLSTFASKDNVVGFNTETGKVTPGRVDLEVGLPDIFLESFQDKYFVMKKEEGFNPGKCWKETVEGLNNIQLTKLKATLISNISHEVGHFLELMRQGEKTFAKVGGVNDENATINNLTSAIVTLAAGKSLEEIKLIFGEYDEFLKKINTWTKGRALRLDRNQNMPLDRKILAKLNSIYDAAIEGKYVDMKPNPAYSIEKILSPSFTLKDFII